ncbi:DgyrCDS10766 [Dimorphilus gyrociliatus]|uniref:DgyrCDS10766 n=1 Tax=Dimorphilus gyrociliatus TaxID=2664684 RepID=A0A7I8W1B8_9ANNE|nr:DgyrCDS10766 [Dimorphilus gyrociliatus]
MIMKSNLLHPSEKTITIHFQLSLFCILIFLINTSSSNLSCSNDQVPCLKTNTCVPKQQFREQECKVTCENNQKFCEKQNKCIQEANYTVKDCQSQQQCPQDEKLCMKTQTCVADKDFKEEDCRPECENGKKFCMMRKSCIDEASYKEDDCKQMPHCTSDEKYCMKTKECVAVKDFKEDECRPDCENGKKFCMMRKACIDEATFKEDDCKPMPHCTSDEEYCLKTKACVAVKDFKEDECRPDCENGTKFCMMRKSCIDEASYKEDDCKPIPQCGQDEKYCMKTKACVAVKDFKEEDCRPECENGKKFCMRRKACIDESSYKEDDCKLMPQCGQDKKYCMKTKECVAVKDFKEEDCRPECENGKKFCMRRKACIDEASYKEDDCKPMPQCGQDEKYCMKTKACVAVKDFKEEDCRPECENGKKFCMRRKACIDESSYKEDDCKLMPQCGQDEKYCMKTKACVAVKDFKEEDCRPECENGKKFCMKRKACIDESSYKEDDCKLMPQCGQDKKYCMKTKECVAVKDFKEEDCRPECENGKKFCMRRKACIDEASYKEDDCKPMPQCGQDEKYCMKTKACVAVKDFKEEDCRPECENGKKFCMRRKACIDEASYKEDDCKPMPQCGQDEKYCMKTKACVAVKDFKEEDCRPECENGKKFCMRRKACIDEASYKEDDCKPMPQCGQDEKYCMKTKACVAVKDFKEEDCRPECENGKKFCMRRKACIDESSYKEDDCKLMPQCGQDKKYCMKTKECVAVKDFKEEDCRPECENGKKFCMRRKACIDEASYKEDDCKPMPQCGQDEKYCMKTKACVAVKDFKEEDCRPECENGKKFCMRRKACIDESSYKEDDCKLMPQCGQDEKYCMKTKACVAVKDFKEEDCRPECENGKKFCMKRKACIDESSYKEDDCKLMPQCGQDKKYCMKTKECVAVKDFKEEDCRPECENGKKFCMRRKACIDEATYKEDDCKPITECTSDEKYCMKTKACVAVKDFKEEDCRVECENGKKFCMRRKACIDEATYKEDDCKPITQCAQDEKYCMKTKKCVAQEDYKEVDCKAIANCGSNEKFCLKTKKCIAVELFKEEDCKTVSLICPVVAGGKDAGTCGAVCKDENDCGAGKICCTSACGGKTCTDGENSNKPIGLLIYKNDKTTLESLVSSIKVVGGEANNLLFKLKSKTSVSLSVTEKDSTNNEFLSAAGELSVTGKHGWYSYSLEIYTPNKVLAREMDVMILKFPVNQKPVLTLKKNVINTDEDSESDDLNIESFFDIEDNEIKPAESWDETKYGKMSPAAKKYEVLYHREVELASKAKENAIFIMQFPRVQNVKNIKSSLFVKDSKGARRKLSMVGGVVKSSDKLIVKPVENFHGEFKLSVYPVDDSGRREIANYVRSSKINELFEFLKSSVHVGVAKLIVVKVAQSNDSPYFLKNDNFFSLYKNPATAVKDLFVPEKNDNYQGATAKSIVNSFYGDEETKDLGMAVFMAQESTVYGNFEYQKDGGAWTKLIVGSDLTYLTIDSYRRVIAPLLFKLQGSSVVNSRTMLNDVLPKLSTKSDKITLVYLKPNDRIRYLPKDWSASWEKKKIAHFGFYAWDMNNKTPTESIDGPLCKSDLCGGKGTLSFLPVLSLAQKVDCNGVPGGSIKRDKCDKCAGGNECLKKDCNGEVKGTAFIDLCGNCVGGSTTKKPNYARDCSGRCNGNFTLISFQTDKGEEKICLDKNTNTTKFLFSRWCDGKFKSSARLNKCKKCFGGSTGLTNTAGMDVCGICGGDGKSCLDCKGTVRGTATVDKCNKCKEAKDKTRDTDCISLFSIKPMNLFYTKKDKLIITGVGINLFKTVEKCSLSSQSDSNKVNLLDSKIVNINGETVVVANYDGSAAAGTYKAECLFKGDTEKTLTSEKTIVLIGNPKVTKFSVKSIQRGSSDVQTGMATVEDTLENPVCFFICPPNSKSLPFCAARTKFSKFVEKNHLVLIGCKKKEDTKLEINLRMFLKIQPTSLNINIANILPTSASELQGTPSVSLKVIGTPPSVKSVRFSSNLCYLFVKFDKVIEIKGRDCISKKADYKECCKAMWKSADLDKFGTGAECLLTNNGELAIRLGKENRNLVSGTTLSLIDDIIKERGVDDSVAAYLTSQTIDIPDIKGKLFATLIAPEKVGGDSNVNIRAKVGGAQGCTKLNYEWTLEFITGQNPNADAQTKLDSTKSNLKNTGEVSLGGSDLAPGYNYKITLKATNFIGTSITKTAEFEKATEDLPISVNLIAPDQAVDPKSNFRLSTSIIVEKTLSKVRYSYSVMNSIDFKLDFARSRVVNLNGRKLKLQGGKTYEVQVTVDYEFKQGNAVKSGSLTASAKFETKILPLVVLLKGKGKMEESATESLDGSLSFDPNVAGGSLTDAIYEWTCEKTDEGTGGLCYDVDGNVYTKEKFDNSLEISGSKLGQGKYKFCLKIQKDTIKTSNCKEIEIVKEPAPVLLDYELKSFSTSATIKAKVESKKPAAVSWSALFEDGTTVASIAHSREISTTDEKPDCIFYGPQVIGKEMQQARVWLKCQSLKINAVYKIKLEIFRIDENGEQIESENEQDANSLFDEEEFEIITPGAPEILDISVDKKTAQEITEEIKATVNAIDDEENLPLRFSLEICDEDDNCRMISPNSPKEQHQFTLPKGKFRYGYTVCNRFDICTQKQSDVGDVIDVTALNLDKTSAADLDLEGLAESSEDPLAALNNFVSGSIGEKGKTNPEFAEAIENVKSSVVSGSLDKLDTSNPKEGANQLAKVLDKRFLPKVISKEIVDKLVKGLEDLLESLFPKPSNSLRKKRATSTSPTKDPMTASQVKTFIDSQDIELKQSLTSANSKDFQENVKKYVIGMCRGPIIDQDAIVAEADLATIRLKKRNFNDISSMWLDAACQNCTNDAKIKLDNETEDELKQWNCSAGTCLGACIGSVAITRDVISISTTALAPLNSPLKSNIMALFLLNYETENFVAVSNSKVQIKVPVVGTVNNSFSLECRFWESGKWNNSICSSGSVMTQNGSSSVICTCSMYNSYVALFEAPLEETTTDAMTTAAAMISTEEMTTQAVNPSKAQTVGQTKSGQTDKNNVDITTEANHEIHIDADKVKAQFSLNADYNTIVQDKAAFETSMVDQLAVQLSINKDRISGLSVEKGSIIVIFSILKGSSGPTLGQVLTNLQTKVTSAQLVIKSPSGATLAVMQNSFHYTPPTPAPTPSKKDDDDNSKTKTIIIVVCVLVGVLLIVGIIVAVCLVQKNNQQQKKIPSYNDQASHRPLTGSRPPPYQTNPTETGYTNQGFDTKSKSLVSLSNLNSKSASRPQTAADPDRRSLYNDSRTPAPLSGSTYGALAPLESEIREQPSLARPGSSASSTNSRCPSRVGTPGSVRLNSGLGRISPGLPGTPTTPRSASGSRPQTARSVTITGHGANTTEYN